ncbi:MAG: hypothetical protein LBP51_04920 [Deferribacteraceae bacterium]|jgi:hypothetical protein|nr:hypothetical protein [Deferribacteraceae bacterium]
MRKPFEFLLVFLFVYPQYAAAYYADFTYLTPDKTQYSYVNGAFEESHSIIPQEPIDHKEVENSSFKTLFNAAQEISPAVANYMFDDNVTKTELYIDLTSSLLSFAIRMLTKDQFNLRVREITNGDNNKSDYSVELGLRPNNYLGLNFLIPNSEYMFALSLFPSKDTVFSFIISDNQSSTVTGFNINSVF